MFTVDTHNINKYSFSRVIPPQLFLDPPLCVRTFYIFTPNKFLFRFKFSSFTISRLFSFLLVSVVKFH